MFRLLRGFMVVPFVIFPLIMANAVLAKDGWRQVADHDLSVDAGSALDFSALVEPGPAGKNGWAIALPEGHLGFEHRATPQRFLIASMVFTKSNNGGVPDKAGTERLVQQLKRSGYNLVRLHFVDAYLMHDRMKDFDFDPEQFDRLHYLLAQLKAAGIYWIVDGLASDNGAWGNVQPHRWVKKHRAKLDVLTSEKGFRHWATLVERVWGAKNPYTGSVPLQDPAMLGIILVNEGSVGFMATLDGGVYPNVLAPLFQSWLKTRYGTDAALQKAWGRTLEKGESLAASVRMPKTIRGKSPRDADFARFVSELERSAYTKMNEHVRKLGFKGLTTAYDNWPEMGPDISRQALDWVDMHAYHAYPTKMADPGSRIPQTSVHSNSAKFVRGLSSTRQWGKPFTVSEYGQIFWNRFRHESAALVPAFAAHQGFDAICQYGEIPIQVDYGSSPYTRRQAIYPYNIGADPIARAGERLAAVLFLRGDVAASPNHIRVHWDADKVHARSAGWEYMPEELSKLAFISPLGLDFRPIPQAPKSGELWVNLTGSQPWWSVKTEKGPAAGRDLRSDSVAALRDRGIIDSGNLSQPGNRRFQSDTGQFLIDSGAGLIKVNTDRTVALVFNGGNASAGALSIRSASVPVLFAVSSLDGKPITQSRRMLLWALTDAINTGMTFADAERTTLKAIGKFPPQLQTISAVIKVATEHGAELKAWPLSLSGVRREPIPLTRVGDAVELQLDTARMPEGPAVFFEIATK
ncbi:beta-galactosidase [Nitrosospira briensis]|uniref:beta-galactosidase n=1 Tax=Nitrosospira briensis TaxID=35799 RepID=UPI001160B20B|nr:beta-galactosidase [Nitrosospira briensis]